MNKRPRRPATADALVFSLLGTAHALEARLEAALDRIGLSLAKLGLLAHLAEAREPLPLSELAEMQACVRSNITQLVDRLERDGFVRRRNDAADRRSVRAALTAAGRRAHGQGMTVLAREQAAIVAGLGPNDAAHLRAALGVLGR